MGNARYTGKAIIIFTCNIVDMCLILRYNLQYVIYFKYHDYEAIVITRGYEFI